MTIYESCARPLLFRLDPERAHELALRALAAAKRCPGGAALLGSLFRLEHPSLATTVAGLRFPNPVGLAAGFDKDCALAGILPSLGFGFLELGTVTPRPQAGGPKPRLFRIPEAGALINRMGFNNCGAAAAAEHLRRLKARPVPLGINLGMNADTPHEKAHKDYVEAFDILKAFGDYFVVNVSSPNTLGLRDLQERIKLERILTALRSANDARKPIFVKLAPDLDPGQLASLVSLLVQEADGVVVSNTTVARDGVPDLWADTRGGLSGAPLKGRSSRLIAEIYRLTRGKLPIIGTGGIFGAEDAYEKLRAGASLIQVYTGLIYRGPRLVRDIKEGLAAILENHGLRSVAEAVGRTHGADVEPVPVKSGTRDQEKKGQIKSIFRNNIRQLLHNRLLPFCLNNLRTKQ